MSPANRENSVNQSCIHMSKEIKTNPNYIRLSQEDGDEGAQGGDESLRRQVQVVAEQHRVA